MRPLRLALGYESRVGKDTIADILEPYGFKRFTFAAPLHNAIQTFKQGINDTGDTKYRNAMISMANEAKRVCGDDIFVKIVENKILAAPESNIVVTDLRELQQLDMLKKYDFKYVYVTRKNRDTTNPSVETELSHVPPDMVIINNGSLSDLTNQVTKVFKL